MNSHQIVCSIRGWINSSLVWIGFNTASSCTCVWPCLSAPVISCATQISESSGPRSVHVDVLLDVPNASMTTVRGLSDSRFNQDCWSYVTEEMLGLNDNNATNPRTVRHIAAARPFAHVFSATKWTVLVAASTATFTECSESWQRMCNLINVCFLRLLCVFARSFLSFVWSQWRLLLSNRSNAFHWLLCIYNNAFVVLCILLWTRIDVCVCRIVNPWDMICCGLYT